MKPLLLGALASVLLASFARSATASATFPEALRSKLELAEVAGPAPGCRLCHQDDLGGLKTATKPLGRSLLKAGAAGASVPSLLAALDSLQAGGTDSDRDGTPDIAELKAGTDPNVAVTDPGAPAPGDDIPLPETGCGLVRASSEPSASAALLGAMLFLLRRSRRRH
jgi:MYXO-CTERM domain-containing protein